MGAPRQPEQVAFGSRLRLLRQLAGLSQEALADRAGVSVSTLAALESQRRKRPHPHTVSLLASALGLEPAERASLHDLIDAAPSTPPALAIQRSPKLSLPVPPTSLIGRDAEVAQARALLDPTSGTTRLLTLVGPGGVGKTRLALAVAASLIGAYADGIVFVDLAALRDDRLVAATIARALELGESGGRSAREILQGDLRLRQVLLVLDNLEHLLAAAPLLAGLLENCRLLALLVTSRTVLRLRAEQRLLVAPLATPSDPLAPIEAIAASPSVRLFVERARSVAPDFVLDANNATAVAAVCRRVDGLPLALELAAARVVVLPAAALLQRLERRLAVLTRGARDQPARHQTLRSTLAWSYDLLGPREQVLFRRLAVFAGRWSLSAAEAICAYDTEARHEDTVSSLQALVDSSLVQRLHDDVDDAHFAMLETVGEFATERLEESNESGIVRSHHASWYIDWVEGIAPLLIGRDQVAWYARLDRELDNLRSVRAWCRQDTRRGEAELRLAAALGRYWWIRAPGQEGRVWLAEALDQASVAPASCRAGVLTWSGQLDYLHGDPVAGQMKVNEAVRVARIAGDRHLLCLTLRHQALYSADRTTAATLLEETVIVASAAGDQRELALAQAYLSGIREWQGDLAEAYALSASAVAAGRASGDAAALAEALRGVGRQAVTRGEYASAQTAFQESLELSEAIGYRSYVTTVNRQLAWLALAQGDLAVARERVAASLQMARVSGNGADGLRPLLLAAMLAVRLGNFAQGVRLFAAVSGLQHQHGIVLDSTLWTRWTLPGDAAALSLARATIGEERFEELWASGNLLPLDAALEEALALTAQERVK